MIKTDEINNPQSCLNRAFDEEMVFVLRACDEAAPVALRAWCAERIRIGKNLPDDEQILDALAQAATMTIQRPEIRARMKP